MNRKILILFLFLNSAFSIFSKLSARENDAPPYVCNKKIAEVNKELICECDFLIAIATHRAEVIQYFRDTYHAEYDSNFWKKSFPEGSPAQVLKSRALEDCVRSKLLLQAGKNGGVISTVSFHELERERVKENRKRLEMVRNGGVVYGPIEYTPESYLKYTLDKIVLSLYRQEGVQSTNLIEIEKSIKKRKVILFSGFKKWEPKAK